MANTTQENDHFGRVYQSIREQVVRGEYAPGSQIKVNEAAAQLRLSSTPVREALSRLVGEGLLEDRRRVGFFVPRPSSYELVDLYLMSELCLTAALKGQFQAPRPQLQGHAEPPGWSQQDDEGLDGADAFGALFAAILRRSSNRLLIETGQLFLDRLAAARRVESLVLGNPDYGFAALSEAARSEDGTTLLTVLRAYHRARRTHAEQISYLLANAVTEHR